MAARRSDKKCAPAAPELPAYKVEEWSAERLKPYARNARVHGAEQIGQLRSSFRRFGQVWPILVREDGTIIAGHGRLEAAKAEGFKAIKVIVAAGWTDEQCRAFGLLDNRVPLNAEWNTELLGMELSELDGLGADLAGMGFEPLEVSRLLPTSGHTGLSDPESVPEPPKNPVTTRGDLWALGRHRLLCGDSTRGEDVARLLAGASVDLILTDPPYCSGGFQESSRSTGSVGTDAEHKKIANDTLSTRGFQALLKTSFSAFNAPFLYSFTDWRMWVYLFDIAESSGFGVRSMIVWDKGTPGMGRGWRTQHELILWACNKTAPWDRKDGGAGNVIQCKRTGNVHHTTEKPVEIIEALLTNTPFAAVVADPFAGSGTTLIGCESVGRQFYGAELDPAYVDVCIKRWQDFTGQKATLDGDGRTFEEIAAERHRAAA